MRKEAEMLSETPVELWLSHHPTRNNLTEFKIMKKSCFLLVLSSWRMQHQPKDHQLLKGIKIIRWDKLHTSISPPPIQAVTSQNVHFQNWTKCKQFCSALGSEDWGTHPFCSFQSLQEYFLWMSFKTITMMWNRNLTNSYHKLEGIKAMAC